MTKLVLRPFQVVPILSGARPYFYPGFSTRQTRSLAAFAHFGGDRDPACSQHAVDARGVHMELQVLLSVDPEACIEMLSAEQTGLLP